MIPGQPQDLVGCRTAGFTISQWLDADETSAWFEGTEDSGAKKLLYLYTDREERDRARLRVHGFRTTFEAEIETSSGATPGFWIVGDHRLMMPGDLRAALTSADTRPERILEYDVEKVLGRGYKGVTYKVRRVGGVRTPYALKVTLAEEYATGSYLPEADRMADLAIRDRDHFPQIHQVAEWKVDVAGRMHQLVVFVEDFIEGDTLADFLTKKAARLSARFLESFLREMLAALKVMYDLEFMHDDLHAGNIMIHELFVGARPYVIDFGSLKRRGPTRKTRDDIRNLAMHLASIANLIYSLAEPRSHYDDSVLAACDALLAEMSDDDPLRRPEDAGALLQKFDAHITRGSFKQELMRPFDFGNAEEVMDNALLLKLAAKSFPWRRHIESSANMLVIGPRGCGKTTVFRSTSFVCIAEGGDIDEALRRPYLGLYISCNKDFRQRFSSLPGEALTLLGNEIRHYFGLLVLRELTSTISSCWQHSRITPGDIAKFSQFVRARARIELPPETQPLKVIREIETSVARGIHAARMAVWEGRKLHQPLDQGFVADVARLVGEELSSFVGKVLYLFVDDYTERKVPREAQRALNHILFVPNSAYKAKISSEVFGVAPDQTLGAFLDQDRDYKEWNLGTLFYLDLPSEAQKEFLQEIVDNRLALCGYTGRVKDIVGESAYAEETLARSLKAEAETRAETKQKRKSRTPVVIADAETERELEQSGRKTYYHGWDTICDLCTGDVSNVLEVLARIYDECGVLPTTTSRITPSQQDAVIQAYSFQYINKIKGIPMWGDRLFEMVDAFGNMAAALLRTYPWIERGPGRKDPYQLIRVELDEALTRSGDEELELHLASDRTGELNPALLWVLLQRHSIFVDADESRSRRNTLASKVILRRIFGPAFRIGLVNSESYTLNKAKWAAFCTDPKGTAERYVKDVVERARGRREDRQLSLPEED